MTPLERDAHDKAAHNEQVKLLATFLNGVGLAIFAVGGLAPIFASSPRLNVDGFVKAGVTVLCFVVAFYAHVAARRALRRLRP
jgi:hypothetical protein